nr:phage tail tape measure protein [Vibrio aestuarianus]
MVGLGLLAAGGAASAKSMDNEANFVDVAKNINFTDERDKQNTREELNRLARDMAGVNDTDVMKIAAGGANGGIAKEDLVNYTKDTIMTATAWDMTPDEAAQKGMAMRNSLNYADGEQGRAQFMQMANMINDVANKNGGVSGKDLIGVMSRRGAQMTNAGFSEAGALGLSGALLSKGATEEQAATATGGITKALVAGFSATTAQQDIYSMIGMDAETVAASMQDNAMGTLTDVLEGLKDLNVEDQAAAISQLFGEEAAPHVQKLIKDTKTLNKIKEDALNADSESVRNEYDEIAATNAAKYERTANAISNFAVVMGDRLLPIVEPLREGFTDVVIAATEFLSANEGVGTAIAAGAALAVTAVGAYKAYQAVKFAKGLAGIAKETMALKRAQSATDKHTAALERNARASSRAAANERGGNRRKRRGRTGRSRNRTRRGGRLGGLLSDGLSQLTGGFDAMPDRAPRKASRRRKGGLLALGAGMLAGGFSMPSFAGGMDGAADVTGAATDMAEALPFAKATKAARAIRPVAMVMDGVSAATSLAQGDYQAASETGGGFLGGMGGAALGGMIGSFILPGIGTAIGAAIGGLAGDEVGSQMAGGLFDWITSDDDQTAKAEPALNKPLADPSSVPPMSADIKAPNEWYSQVKINTPTEAIKTAQAKEVQARQTPHQTFAPQIILQSTGSTEEDAQITMDRLRELWDEWQREREDGLDQNLSHSLVT